MKVLNFGSLNIDFVYSLDHIVVKGETIASKNLQIFSGGKGLNQSVAMGKAGANVFHAGAIGQDGNFLLDVLKDANVDVRHVLISDCERTGNAIIQRDKNGDNCIILYGGTNRCINKSQIDNTIAMFEKGDYIVLQNEINEMPYIMQKAHEIGMKIVLNPSPMDEKIFELPLNYVDYFILNEVELAQLLNISNVDIKNIEEISMQLLNKFKEASIIVTLGAYGSIYRDKNTYFMQKAYATKVVDTTAAGDTFSGYIVAALISGSSIKEAMELATKAASIAVSRTGAAPSIPKMKEVIAYEV